VTNLVAAPLQVLKEKKSAIADNWRLIYLTRISEGVVAVKNSTEAQQAEIVRKFEEAKPGVKERRDDYNSMLAKRRSEGTNAYCVTNGYL
jgi:hypothetical protein